MLRQIAHSALRTTLQRGSRSIATTSRAAFTYVAPAPIDKDQSYRFGLAIDQILDHVTQDKTQASPVVHSTENENENQTENQSQVEEASVEQIRRILSLTNASQRDLNQAQIAQSMERFQRFPGDTGSSEVQIAVLTQKILHSTAHAQGNKHDNQSRRGLIAMVQKRRKLLQFLRRKDLPKYRAVVATLGLRFT